MELVENNGCRGWAGGQRPRAVIGGDQRLAAGRPGANHRVLNEGQNPADHGWRSSEDRMGPGDTPASAACDWMHELRRPRQWGLDEKLAASMKSSDWTLLGEHLPPNRQAALGFICRVGGRPDFPGSE